MLDRFEASENPLMQLQGFEEELQDFIENSDFDQFVDLIRGEDENPLLNFDRDLITNGCFLDFNDVSRSDGPEFMPLNGSENLDGGEVIGGGEEEDDEGDSSATTSIGANKTTTKRSKLDRSRTLISERRRRGRMKEKLFALRSLVPNITKMDKASIVGDAVIYVQELQMEAKKLKAELKGIEASMQRPDRYYQGVTQNNSKKIHRPPNPSCLASKKIIQMDIFQVEERGFYLRILCDKGYGVALSLYKVLESMMGFEVQSTNLMSTAERFVLTATLNVMKDLEQETNLPKLKLWLTGALLSHGFEFKSPLPT